MAKDGLFEVTDRVCQVRGFDIASIIFIEAAAAAFSLHRKHRCPEYALRPHSRGTVRLASTSVPAIMIGEKAADLFPNL